MNHHSTQRQYWRSLEHLAKTPEIVAASHNEFGSYDPDEMLKMPELTRRRFMQLASASMALAGLTLSGCRRWPQEKLAPYTSNPKNRVPGIPEQYATAMELNGVAAPLLVTSFDGRPIKVEGNPTHPFSATIMGKMGAADAIAQASVLEVYDPDRSTRIIDRTGSAEKDSDWNTFADLFRAMAAAADGNGGDGLAVLSECVSGPTTARLKALVAKKYPKLRWYEYEPLTRDNETDGGKQAAGRPVRSMLHLDRASTVVLFDADILGTHPAHVRYAADWSSRRGADNISRVFIAESAFSITGSVADVRIGAKPSRIPALLGALAAALGVGSADEPSSPQERAFIDQAVADLKASGGAGVVAVASHLPADCHAMALAVNNAIGAIGQTVTLHQLPDADRPSHLDSIGNLAADAKSGAIKMLLLLGGNPAYDAPADVDVATAIGSIPSTVHLSLFDNETSKLCKWHVPRAHYLEAWSDTRAWDGTISVVQPLIQPLYDGKTIEQMLALLAGETSTDSDILVRSTFSALLPSGDSDAAYRSVLNDGLLAGSAFPVVQPTITYSSTPAAAAQTDFEVRFAQDSRVYDGRFAGNGWLQEMPDPLTKVVWDNVACIGLKDAEKLGVSTNDMVKITVAGRSLTLAAYVLPGQPAGVIGLTLGYGRTAAGHIGTDVGFNTYSLRTRDSAFYATDVKVEKTGDTYTLATTQDQYLLDTLGMDQRADAVGEGKFKSGEIIREATAAAYKADAQLFHRNEDGSLGLQLWEPPNKFNDPHAWGMAIDLSSCIGCHACVIACQAENNVPIVGKDQVLHNRQMHWIRIDRYFKGEPEDASPEIVYQPLTCQHCENAPCEQVCPVGATMHDTEGLNVMVYNRCVGTRYCSNNCPYKVRRFNYLDWHSQDPRHDKYPKPYLNLPDQQQLEQIDPMKRMVFNPEVTVRMRGVMEKCTFCVQRIHNTKIAKSNAGVELADGDIVTACQQACPTRAIFFGDLNDANSKVSQLHRDGRAYGLLDADLNTRPRNMYLAKISNPVETKA